MSKTEDARNNGSTGPRTKNGKKASRANAVKHGLSSTLLIPGLESREELTKRHRAYKRAYAPQGPAERECVRMLVAASWQLQRAERFERAEVLRRNVEDYETEPKGEPHLRIPEGTANATDMIMRYHSLHLRKYLRALQTLRELREARGAPPLGKVRAKKGGRSE